MTTLSAASTGSNPRFHGLFVGINRYASADIDNLASAVRDARALHALFSDNLGGNCRPVTDAEVTTARLRAELAELQTSSLENDVVVIAFSGHGSDTHEIITYDADLYNLPATALPLDEFTDLVSAIPAKHLLVILDCCFSGGAGAKVLNAPLVPRGATGGAPLSTDALLTKMAGTGRLILTASTADQPAWEDLRLGHGLLTHHLLAAFLGPADLAQDGRINLLDLLKYVTQQVKASASGTASARQEPTLRGRWDGEVVWPTFTPGPLYSVLYPPATRSPVTADIGSLREHGIPESVLGRWAASLPGLNPLQQDAVNEARLLNGRNVLVMAPTSSGKTMIGELAALRATQNGGRSVFLLPTKALVNEQHDKFERTYGPVGVRTVRATGDFNDQVTALLRGQFDIAVLTYEKFTGLALANPHLLRMISVIVIDEVQSIVDPSRGANLEFLLTLLKSRSADGVEPQIIALSAVLGALGGLDSWLDANLLRRTERPVPLEEGVLDLNGSYRYIDADGTERAEQVIPPRYGEPRARTLLIPLVQKLVAEGQQVIVIRGIRGETRGAAKYLADSLGLAPATTALAALPEGDPSIASSDLRQCLEGGVAFHISDLDRDERRVVEDNFRLPDSAIRVVVATTTLAQGVNMPAETVVIPEVSRRVGANAFQQYTVASYKNIAGRAGRLGLTQRGRAIVLAYGRADSDHIWSQYIKGTPEDMRSTLLDPDADMYTIVLRVVAVASQQTGPVNVLSQDDVVAVLANSFAAHQNRLTGSGDTFEPTKIAPVLEKLRNEQFIEDDGTSLRLTPLGAVVAESGLAVQSAIIVAGLFRRLQPNQLNRAALITAAQLTQELDETRLIVNVRGVRKEIQTFVSQLSRQGAAKAVIEALAEHAESQTIIAARAKKAVACLLWMIGMPSAQLERLVMQHYMDRSAIGPIRAVAARTQDVIGPIVEIATVIHPEADLTRLAGLLPVQLELGIPADLAPLATADADLAREHYLNLVEARLGTPDLIGQAEDDTLLKCVGAESQRLRTLRAAVRDVLEAAAGPTLAGALPLPTD
jgi:replicative superfamily II helicase